MAKFEDKKQLKCSFCGKNQDQVKRLIAGPVVYICDECIDLCSDIIQDEFEDNVELDTTALPKPTEIKTSKPVVATPTLRKGSKNKQVKYLQQDLNYLLGSNLVADGIFGTKTVSVVKSFQKKYGLGVDGIYGQKSYTKMKDLLT